MSKKKDITEINWVEKIVSDFAKLLFVEKTTYKKVRDKK